MQNTDFYRRSRDRIGTDYRSMGYKSPVRELSSDSCLHEGLVSLIIWKTSSLCGASTRNRMLLLRVQYSLCETLSKFQSFARGWWGKTEKNISIPQTLFTNSGSTYSWAKFVTATSTPSAKSGVISWDFKAVWSLSMYAWLVARWTLYPTKINNARSYRESSDTAAWLDPIFVFVFVNLGVNILKGTTVLPS